MLEDRYNYLPVKKTKSNVFSVRITDKDHKALLKVALAKGECRAVTFVELAQKGLELYAAENGISLREEDIDKYLVEHGLIEPERH